MADILIEGYDHLTAAQFITKQGRTVQTQTVATGRFGTGQCAYMNGTNGSLAMSIPGAPTTFGVGTAFRIESVLTQGNNFVKVFNGGTGGTEVVGVRLVASGGDSVLRMVNSAGTTLATGTTPIALNVWYQMEFKVVVHASTGTVELRLNGLGTAELSATGLNTGSLAPDTLQLRTYTGETRWDDTFVWDTTGSSPTNDWHGDARVETLFADGNGNSTAWTGAFGDWDDTTSHDADTTYVHSSTPGDRETSTLGALVATAGTVFSVQTVLMARKDDASARTIAPVIRTGGTDYDGTTTGGLTSSYVGYTQIYDRLDPSGAAWTIATVNAMEAGVKEVS